MKVVCVSASNTKYRGENSASTRVCSLISKQIKRTCGNTTEVEIIPLANYDLTPCHLYGDCSTTQTCLYDQDFNTVYEKLAGADALFWVVPHYSPIPSKLIIILEKINEISYASWTKNPKFQTPFHKKITAIVGHGGMPESPEVLQYYHNHLVTPVADILRSLSFKIVPLNDQFPNGAVFGLANSHCLKKVEGSIFPDVIQDYEMINSRIEPLVKNVMQEVLE
jgi:multimeric flavodoxin WrbA